jgi:hypothetical protein
MAKGKWEYLLLLPLLLLLSLPLRCRPCLPLQPRCNNCCCHGRCLCCYHCRLLHFVDCCLPPLFLLLSATSIATVATAATVDTVSAAVAITIRPHCHCHCPCCPCTCPLLCPTALLPLPLPTSSQLALLAHHLCRHHSCHHCHRPLHCMTPLSPLLLLPSPSPSLSHTTLIVVTIALTFLAIFVAALIIRRMLTSYRCHPLSTKATANIALLLLQPLLLCCWCRFCF